jgi:peroxidase
MAFARLFYAEGASFLKIFGGRMQSGKKRFNFMTLLATVFGGAAMVFIGAVLETRSFSARAFAQEDAASDVEPVDGSGNNINNPDWGIAGGDLLRLAPPDYGDGIDSPALSSDKSAREVSNLINNQAEPNDTAVDISTVDRNSLSDFGYAFGQFMDHDMDNTPDGGASLPIAVAAGDPIGPDPLPFTRSVTDPATGAGTGKPAQQITVVTAYFDLSQIYGSSQAVADALRTFSGGQMKTSPGNMPPLDNTNYFTTTQIAALDMANDSQAVPESDLFAAGDVRANENIELTALQVLFLRNHNRIAAIFQTDHPDWTDEEIYQEARKINIAQYQNIIYSEWIPAVMGPRAMMPYTGYKPNVNATIANEFSTVAYRFGHSLVSPSIARDGNEGQEIGESAEDGDIPLALDFFDPYLLNPSGAIDPLTGLASTSIGPILKADADGNGQEMDVLAVSSLRNLLFGNGIEGGQDLIALDVQRGRDHGVANYNAQRIAMGLPAVTSFAQITKNVDVQKELAAAYPGGVGTIDAFEGGLAEDHVPASDVGPLFQAVMANQFQRLRDGDRFFYLGEDFDSEETGIFQQTNTLANVIMANTGVTNLQANVFLFQASIGGTVSLTGGSGPNGMPGPQVTSIIVELQDTSGDVLATTNPTPNGSYSFNQLSGPANDPSITPGVSATGFYQVVLALPAALTQVSHSPSAIEITRGDTNVTGVNFTVNQTTSAKRRPPGN